MKKATLQLLVALLSIATIISCSSATKMRSVETASIEFNTTNSGVDSSTYKLIAPYKKEMDKIMNEILGSSDSALLKDLPESSLGNFVSDAVLKKSNDKYKPADKQPADICLLNNGGLRAQLPKGNITRGNVFELMPFENSIVVITLTGEKTKQLFESLIAYNGAPFSGATVKGKGKKMTELKIGGQPFDVTKNYKFPILKANDFGHIHPNTCIPIGSRARMNTTTLTWEITEGYHSNSISNLTGQ